MPMLIGTVYLDKSYLYDVHFVVVFYLFNQIEDNCEKLDQFIYELLVNEDIIHGDDGLIVFHYSSNRSFLSYLHHEVEVNVHVLKEEFMNVFNIVYKNPRSIFHEIVMTKDNDILECKKHKLDSILVDLSFYFAKMMDILANINFWKAEIRKDKIVDDLSSLLEGVNIR